MTNRVVELLTAARAASSPLVLPGAADAITALLVEQIGFEAVYLTGAGLANARFGIPDVGLTTVTELVSHVAAVADVVSIPIVADADAGFGNPVNVRRTVRALERAGAAAVQLEDQVEPKRCGHFAGKDVIPASDMVHKIEAAVDARTGDLAVIARTDACAVAGIDEALDRVRRYRDAGADVLFVEAPRTTDDLERIPREVDGLHLVNLVEGGATPLLGREELGTLGYAAALYANSALRGAVLGARRVLASLRATGSTADVASEMITWDERQDLVAKGFYDAWGQRHSG